MKKLTILAAGALGLAFASAVAGCSPTPPAGSIPEPDEGPVHTLSQLRVEGELVVNAEDEAVMLRGINAGGLGVIEQWMTGFAKNYGEDSAAIDHLTTSRVWIERFGMEETRALWAAYQANWWTEQDFQICKEMGINVIRLPFTYMNVDFDAVRGLEYAGKSYDFTFLDSFVDAAEQHGIYTILDLHGAYGTQNGQDHSGESLGGNNNDHSQDSVELVDFYTNEQKLALTAKLWGAVAEHFRDNPAVAGYDLLNEPAEKGVGETGERHWSALDRFYRAIREKEDGHIVIFESCWTGEGLPMPEEYGWENCIYSFHHYTGTSDYASHMQSMRERVVEVEARAFGVPLYMGEFTCYNNAESWEDTLAYFNERGWHWTSWTYKVWGNMPWGVYNLNFGQEQKINAHEDSLEEIRRKFQNVLTENAVPFAFGEGRTLSDIIKEYASAPSPKEEGGDVA